MNYFKAKSIISNIKINEPFAEASCFCSLELFMFVYDLMMEICPPTNRSHEEDSKAFLKVGKIVGVAKYSPKQRTNAKKK